MSEMTHSQPIPQALKTWFVVHFVVDMLFAIPLMLAPNYTLALLGWNQIDPIAKETGYINAVNNGFRRRWIRYGRGVEDGVAKTFNKGKADGVILATPVYYYNVSAQMKAFIDRNYFLYKHNQEYKMRAVGIIVVAGGEGIEDTLHTLRQFIDELNVNEDDIFVLSGYASKMGDVEKNSHFLKAAKNLGRQMVECLKK